MTSNNIFASITKKASKTFYNASLLFPKDVRSDVFVLYAYVRTIDDFVDLQSPKKDALSRYKKMTKRALDGKKSGNKIIDAFVELVNRKKIKHGWIWDFYESQELDLKNNKYRSFAQLNKFIYGVAETIGLMMARIMDLPRHSNKSARLLGRAMQLLNIIRDIDEDLRLGRVYIPISDMKKFGLKNIKPETKQEKNKFVKLIHFEIDRFEKIIEASKKGFFYIPRKYILPINMSYDLYKLTAKIIARNPLKVFKIKIKPSGFAIAGFLAKNKLGL